MPFIPEAKALRVSNDVSTGVAADLPAVINDYILIARISHPGAHDRVGRFLDQVFAHVALEPVPARSSP